MTMEHEHHQEPGYGYHDGNSQWVEGSSGFHSHHQSPVHEHNGFAFTPMPMEPMYAASSMPPPRTTYQQLQPLITPQWPSMLTSQSSYHTPLFPSAPIQSAPISTPVSAPRNHRKIIIDTTENAHRCRPETHVSIRRGASDCKADGDWR